MKKIILASIFLFIGMAANAQGSYEPYILHSPNTPNYNMEEFESPRPRYQNSQPRTHKETVQTTAYYQDNNGSYVKVPIKVTITASSYGQTISITSYYNYQYGAWTDTGFTSVQKCDGIFGGEMESAFMYKAYLAIFLKTVYFDL